MPGWIAKTITYSVVATLVVACLVIGFQMYDPRALAPIPNEHESSLVGDWFTERFGVARKYVFQADGNGEMWGRGPVPRKFLWGTKGNRLFVKYRGNDSWQAPDFTYELKKYGTELKLKFGSDSGYFPTQFTRRAPATASIP